MRSRGTLLAVIGLSVIVLAVAGGMVTAYSWLSGRWSTPPPPVVPLCQATVGGTTASLEPDQARNAAIIAGVAASRDLVPRAVSIGLATAMQESALRNLDYGDLDSLGLFQQRPSMGWGTVEQVMDPVYAAGKFFEVMVTVDDWQTADIGSVAQAVQRSGYPDAYDQHVPDARTLASALSGETPEAWSCIVPAGSAPDPDRLQQGLTTAYGNALQAVVTPAAGGKPAALTITTASEAVAWSVAAYAQSWASETGVTAVTTGAYQWSPSPDTYAQWTTYEGQASPTTVIVMF